MKKLLLINSSLGSGGAERQMVKLIELLNERNIVPSVLTYGNEKDDYPTTAIMNRINITSTNKINRNIKLLWKIIKLAPDNILSYCGDPNMLALLYKLINWKCNVVTSERNLVQLPLTIRQKLLYFLYRFADKIISNSDSQRIRLSELYPNLKHKIITIRNYTELKEKSIKSLQNPEYPLKILICARYHPQKNIERFLQAVSKINEKGLKESFTISWYGQNLINGETSDYYQKCLEIKNRFGLDNVNLNGYNSRINEVIQKCDVICLPSLYEGFSNSLSEGLCNGKAILASDVSDNKTFVKDGINGYLFDPYDSDDIVLKLSILIENKNCIPQMGKNSYLLAQQLFDKDKFVESYINQFKI